MATIIKLKPVRQGVTVTQPTSAGTSPTEVYQGIAYSDDILNALLTNRFKAIQSPQHPDYKFFYDAASQTHPQFQRKPDLEKAMKALADGTLTEKADKDAIDHALRSLDFSTKELLEASQKAYAKEKFGIDDPADLNKLSPEAQKRVSAAGQLNLAKNIEGDEFYKTFAEQLRVDAANNTLIATGSDLAKLVGQYSAAPADPADAAVKGKELYEKFLKLSGDSDKDKWLKANPQFALPGDLRAQAVNAHKELIQSKLKELDQELAQRVNFQKDNSRKKVFDSMLQPLHALIAEWLDPPDQEIRADKLQELEDSDRIAKFLDTDLPEAKKALSETQADQKILQDLDGHHHQEQQNYSVGVVGKEVYLGKPSNRGGLLGVVSEFKELGRRISKFINGDRYSEKALEMIQRNYIDATGKGTAAKEKIPDAQVIFVGKGEDAKLRIVSKQELLMLRLGKKNFDKLTTEKKTALLSSLDKQPGRRIFTESRVKQVFADDRPKMADISQGTGNYVPWGNEKEQKLLEQIAVVGKGVYLAESLGVPCNMSAENRRRWDVVDPAKQKFSTATGAAPSSTQSSAGSTTSGAGASAAASVATPGVATAPGSGGPGPGGSGSGGPGGPGQGPGGPGQGGNPPGPAVPSGSMLSRAVSAASGMVQAAGTFLSSWGGVGQPAATATATITDPTLNTLSVPAVAAESSDRAAPIFTPNPNSDFQRRANPALFQDAPAASLPTPSSPTPVVSASVVPAPAVVDAPPAIPVPNASPTPVEGAKGAKLSTEGRPYYNVVVEKKSSPHVFTKAEVDGSLKLAELGEKQGVTLSHPAASDAFPGALPSAPAPSAVRTGMDPDERAKVSPFKGNERGGGTPGLCS